MNRLQTKMESAAKTMRYPTSGFTLASMFLLSLFSSSAFANRPAIEDQIIEKQNEAAHKTAEEITQAISETPSEMEEMEVNLHPSAPSSVELMMQQQRRQTYQPGTRLPTQEMQFGETLRIQLLDYPRRGMSMNQVQNEYGQPVNISDGIGKPPITRWTYNDRIVYFEYSTVLHVVAR